MDSQQRAAEIGQFLASRRARIAPEQVGLPVYDAAKRRVAGLRRQEVATLAGLSVDYYNQIERGKVRGVSESVLDAIARALQLDEDERSHLFDLHRAVTIGPQRRTRPRSTKIRPVVQRTLEAIAQPAFIRNPRQDLVCANQLGHALHSPLYPDPLRPGRGVPVNIVRFCFLDPRAKEFFVDWDEVAEGIVNLLRTDAGRDPYDRGISDLVGELSTRSEEFRIRWAKRNVRLHHSGKKRFHHPIVGDVTLDWVALPLPADPGLFLTIYTPEPASPSADAISLLASWAATHLDDVQASTQDQTVHQSDQ